ncbi:MAG: glycosyltransferase family 9 protein [Armatimonadota bacterium]
MISHSNHTSNSTPAPLHWDDTIKRVLLIRLRAIGDTVLFTPVLEVLKRWRPELEIDVLIEPPSAPVLHGNPHISELFVIKRSKPTPWRWVERAFVIAALRRRRYDLAIDLRGYKTSAVTMRQIAARQSVVFDECPLSRLATLRIPSPGEVWGEPCVHNVMQQLAPLKWLGVPVEEIPSPRVFVDPQADERVARRLAEMGVGGRFALLHVGASNRWKIWEPARFARVADYLWERHGLPSMILAAPSEGRIAAEVAKAATHRPQVCIDLMLAETMALIARAALLLGNDSGPAHIAAAVGTPAAAIYGPADPRIWGLWTPGPHRILTADIPEEEQCPRCLFNHCRVVPRCMDRVPVEQVTVALDGLLAEMCKPAGR